MTDPPTQPRERDRIQCLVCGRRFRTLPRHLACAHDMDVEDYRLLYQIPVGVPLVCLDWSDNVAAKNLQNDNARTLTARGPTKGFRQKRSVKVTRAEGYRQLAASGTAAASALDKTARRRKLIEPYPVTAAEAAERLQCTLSAARTFLSYCVVTGKLSRVGRGRYAAVTASRR